MNDIEGALARAKRAIKELYKVCDNAITLSIAAKAYVDAEILLSAVALIHDSLWEASKNTGIVARRSVHR